MTSSTTINKIKKRGTFDDLLKPLPALQRRSNLCPKCNKPCSSKEKDKKAFVRALNQVYHYQCFVCEDCQLPVADKYYSVEQAGTTTKPRSNNKKLIIVCEQDYLKRNGLLCPKCNTPKNTSSHTPCIECPECTQVTDLSHYTFQNQSYCRIHYSQLKERQCDGCKYAVLKQFVDDPKVKGKIWHPECYMIYKFWSIRIPSLPISDNLIQTQETMEKKVTRVWTDLSIFEESSASCITDMLLNVASDAYFEAMLMANQFIMHLEVLFSALDGLKLNPHKLDVNCNNEAKLICNQIMEFFEILTEQPQNVTQKLMALVNGLAQNLKSLICLGLSVALKLETELGVPDGLDQFLSHLPTLEKKRVWEGGRYWFKNPPRPTQESDECFSCKNIIKDTDCYRYGTLQRWHPECFRCSQCQKSLNQDTGYLSETYALYCQDCITNMDNEGERRDLRCSHVSLLEQYLHTLKVDLAKLPLSVKNAQPLDIFKQNGGKRKRQKSILRILSTQQQQHSHGQLDQFRSGPMEKINEQENILGDPPPSRPPTVRLSFKNSLRRAFSATPSSASNSLNRKSRKASVFTSQSSTNSKYLTTLTSSQDFVIRHVALITLRSYIPKSLDDLATLYLYQEQEHNKKQPNYHELWDKLFHIKKKLSAASSPASFKIFGAPLQDVVDRDKKQQTQKKGVTLFDLPPSLACFFDENAMIPSVVQNCVLALLQSDLSVEGIFRKNGNIRGLKQLSEQSTQDDFEQELRQQNSVQLAALLKKYLRELPEPLLTFRLYDLFLTSGAQKNILAMACCLLPKPNRDTMLLIFCCLKQVATMSERNKMDVANLACVVAPNVLFCRPNGGDPRKGAQAEINVVEYLIRYSEELSIIPPDLILLDINQDMVYLNSKQFLHQYTMLLEKKRNSTAFCKSETSSPVTPSSNRRASWIAKLRY